MEIINTNNNGEFFNEKGEKIKVVPIGYSYLQQAFRFSEEQLQSAIAKNASQRNDKINAYTKGIAISEGACTYHPVQFYQVL